VLLLKKLARQNKLDTATIDDVLAEPQSPELRAVLASLRVSVESANSVPFMQLSAPPRFEGRKVRQSAPENGAV
jgi:hypothetical protein